MAVIEPEDYAEYESATFSDILISSLAALTLGGVVWGLGYGLVAGIYFASDYFQIALPSAGLLGSGLQIIFTAGPILAALLVAWRSYVLIIRLD